MHDDRGAGAPPGDALEAVVGPRQRCDGDRQCNEPARPSVQQARTVHEATLDTVSISPGE
jgi:hypothetical protein